MKVELPDGGWASIRDPRKLNEKQSAALEDGQFAAMASVSDPEQFEHIQDLKPYQQIKLIGLDGVKAMREMKWISILTYTQEWSFGDVTMEVLLEDVPSESVVKLVQHIEAIIRATGGPHLDNSPSPDPESPTLPSNG